MSAAKGGIEKKGIFQLVPGEKFELLGKKFIVLRFEYKNMPRIGRVLNAICKDLSAKKYAAFTLNLEVEVTD